MTHSLKGLECKSREQKQLEKLRERAHHELLLIDPALEKGLSAYDIIDRMYMKVAEEACRYLRRYLRRAGFSSSKEQIHWWGTLSCELIRKRPALYREFLRDPRCPVLISVLHIGNALLNHLRRAQRRYVFTGARV